MFQPRAGESWIELTSDPVLWRIVSVDPNSQTLQARCAGEGNDGTIIWGERCIFPISAFATKRLLAGPSFTAPRSS